MFSHLYLHPVLRILAMHEDIRMGHYQRLILRAILEYAAVNCGIYKYVSVI